MLIHTQENDLSIPDKLNWEVATRPLNYKSKGTFTFPKGILKDVPEDMYSCLVRDDTEEFISIVGSRYVATQYKDICEKQAQGLEKSGLLKKGNFTCKDYLFDGYGKFKRDVIWDDFTIEPKVGDLVNFKQSARSSHDGSIPNLTDGTPRKLSCDNGMLSPIWQLIFAFRHTVNFNIEVLADIYEESTKKFFEMEPYFKSMGEKSISKTEVERTLKETICRRIATKKNKKEHNEKLLGWLLEQFNVEAGELGLTVWAFYNTLTHWATHPEQYDYKENTKFHNIARQNSDKVLVFLNTPQFRGLMDR
jgi:hypothetical protein|tara:strand:- start:1705 stop:2622 length:918 start_codon:yes stop_codon:yes gene_type:complete